MKIRIGFVSNSSSSSFVCDVCGTVESGMDASAHDFEMETCRNGHTFCMCHAEGLPELTPNDLRESIEVEIDSSTWMTAERRRELHKELEDTPDDELEDYYNDNYSDNGVADGQCPICSMTHLREADGFAYLKKKFGVTNENILAEIKADFKNYSELDKTLFPKKK